MSSSHDYAYEACDSEDRDTCEAANVTRSRSCSRGSQHNKSSSRVGAFLILVYITLISVALLVVGVGCFLWGRSSEGRCQQSEVSHLPSDWLKPPGNVQTTFYYQKPFAVQTTNESESPWYSLFPHGGGFVQHPQISPEPRCLAVYHQLHCLDAIRTGYWAANTGISPGHHGRPAHVRHCIDYIRQSLMCHADANLEPIDPALGGVTGFGSEKMCRDYSGLTAWADRWGNEGY
ncbi:hypothetical protein F4821DRAFT_250328 [Hypoxylon rubiginosum]|uniref:Uncharacterized protein n=1 Tax=Hypoxylon rubiginosum TaxID=110542 RepID=A0ACC0CKX6_9PEZI|nr:hypothetical protein F4821DRAFT_250328 [Hypoxylon rubiginosum]